MAQPTDSEVRAACRADVAAMQTIYSPYVADTAISFEVEVPTQDEMRRRMVERPQLPWLVASSVDEIVGYAFAYPHGNRAAYRWSVNCSVYIAQPHHRRGFGRLLYERLIVELQELGYVRAIARITLPNASSVALHEDLGFTPGGVLENVGYKCGQWHDVGWWVLRLTETPADDPREPLEWSLLQ
ncbi:MAG TPA: GNAT family N-acetyltransferase [Actinomycetes bacterium]|nr:GNAT family N-acetyltransferase [Actinomycetes bacterium]